MTIGERIQILRKNNGLSQEELAQKILVSRQTVSQWETDQTVPSVDNIYRLKEVLNVSFDELMSDEKAEKEETEEKTEEEKPLEEYENTPEWDELKFALNCASNFDIKKIALLIIPLLALALFDIYMENYGATFGCVITLSAMVLVWVFGVLNTRKKLKNLFLKNGEKEVQQYKVYHDRLEFICLNKGELVSLNVLKRDDIVAFYENEKYYVFQAKNQLFSICKNLVNKDSYFYSFIYKNKEPLKKNKPCKEDTFSCSYNRICFISVYRHYDRIQPQRLF